jgi:hypothetical protein
MPLIEYTPEYFKAERAKALLNTRLELKVYKDKICISHGLANHLGLKEGDGICIAVDPQNPTDWYLFPHPEGFPLKCPNIGKGLEHSNRSLTKKFHDQFGDAILTFPVAKVPVEIDGIHCHAILTAKQAEAKRIQNLTTPKAAAV